MYTKIGFKDRKDDKMNYYIVDGKSITIDKDNSGLIELGTGLNANVFNHMDNGIYNNDLKISDLKENIDKEIENQNQLNKTLEANIEYIKSDIDNRIGKVSKDISNGDLNVIKESGIYSGINMINAPNEKAFYIQVIQLYSKNVDVLQIAYQRDGESEYRRQLVNNVWGEWKRIIEEKDLNDKMDKYGGAFKGRVFAHPNTIYDSGQIRNIILSNSDADISKMNNGEIWIKYK